MKISSLLTPDHILCQHSSSSKKRVLEDIAGHLSTLYPDIGDQAIFTSLISREKLGSTGIGNGIAIPHCRISSCTDIIAMLLTLEKSIDFDAIDNQEVDIIFVLLVPENSEENHLQTLAAIAETFSDKETLQLLRSTKTYSELQDVVHTL